MNNLTNDMTRLCGEIAALRDSRAALISNLVETTKEMLAGFGEARAEMAEQTKAKLREFVLQLKGQVADLLEVYQNDLAGAHRAWYGVSPAPREVPVVAERISKAKEPRKKKR